MLSYNVLYEILRKEKYSENLQPLPKNFLDDMASYLGDKKDQSIKEGDLFLDAVTKSKKQLENSIAIIKELFLRRKKKLLQLVFVAAETGILKRDFENMLVFEREIFEQLVKVFENSDKQISQFMQGRKEKTKQPYKMVLFLQDVEPFVDMVGNLLGPFRNGELANLDSEVSKILVSGGKASFVDEE